MVIITGNHNLRLVTILTKKCKRCAILFDYRKWGEGYALHKHNMVKNRYTKKSQMHLHEIVFFFFAWLLAITGLDGIEESSCSKEFSERNVYFMIRFKLKSF